MAPTRDRARTRFEWLTILLVAGLAHVAGIAGLAALGLHFTPRAYEAPVRVQLLSADVVPGNVTPPTYDAAVAPAEAEPEPEPEEEAEPELPDGQIVETAPPKEEKIPLESDYLAEHNNAVPEETQARKFKINPDILSPVYSEESKMELEDATDVGATLASTGATAGGIDEPFSGKGAPRSSVPSQFVLTNKEGIAAPTVASSLKQDVRGAPQNDLLSEKYGPGVSLNTREMVGAEYIKRIRRQVNFYWKQNLDNLSPSVRLGKPRFRTAVSVVLSANGVLESIELTADSGQPAVDDCVVNAFRVAGPFPNPPVQLIGRDNRVYLPNFEFTVEVGVARMEYNGVDPRANVQFPGILNAPR